MRACRRCRPGGRFTQARAAHRSADGSGSASGGSSPESAMRACSRAGAVRWGVTAGQRQGQGSVEAVVGRARQPEPAGTPGGAAVGHLPGALTEDLGLPDWVPTASSLYTTSIPSSTRPNTTCRPSSHAVFTLRGSSRQGREVAGMDEVCRGQGERCVGWIGTGWAGDGGSGVVAAATQLAGSGRSYCKRVQARQQQAGGNSRRAEARPQADVVMKNWEPLVSLPASEAGVCRRGGGAR